MIDLDKIPSIYEELPNPEVEQIEALQAVDALATHIAFRDQMASTIVAGGTLSSEDERAAQRIQAEVSQNFN